MSKAKLTPRATHAHGIGKITGIKYQFFHVAGAPAVVGTAVFNRDYRLPLPGVPAGSGTPGARGGTVHIAPDTVIGVDPRQLVQ